MQECELCGGDVGVMGQLGDLVHLHCRCCGMWFQKKEEEVEATCDSEEQWG